jgi:hypothetical protein
MQLAGNSAARSLEEPRARFTRSAELVAMALAWLIASSAAVPAAAAAAAAAAPEVAPAAEPAALRSAVVAGCDVARRLLADAVPAAPSPVMEFPNVALAFNYLAYLVAASPGAFGAAGGLEALGEGARDTCARLMHPSASDVSDAAMTHVHSAAERAGGGFARLLAASGACSALARCEATRLRLRAGGGAWARVGPLSGCGVQAAGPPLSRLDDLLWRCWAAAGGDAAAGAPDFVAIAALRAPGECSRSPSSPTRSPRRFSATRHPRCGAPPRARSRSTLGAAACAARTPRASRAATPRRCFRRSAARAASWRATAVPSARAPTARGAQARLPRARGRARDLSWGETLYRSSV